MRWKRFSFSLVLSEFLNMTRQDGHRFAIQPWEEIPRWWKHCWESGLIPIKLFANPVQQLSFSKVALLYPFAVALETMKAYKFFFDCGPIPTIQTPKDSHLYTRRPPIVTTLKAHGCCLKLEQTLMPRRNLDWPHSNLLVVMAPQKLSKNFCLSPATLVTVSCTVQFLPATDTLST